MKGTFLSGVVAVALVIGAGTAQALVDSLDTTGNLEAFGNGETIINNLNGTVTLELTTTGGDAGMRWRDAGLNLAIPGEHLFTITPTGSSAGANYTVSFGITHNAGFSELFWLNQETSTSQQSVDVQQFALNNALVNPTEYFVHIRIGGPQGAQFTYTEFAAIPEPTTFLLVGAGLGALALARRRR